MWKKIQERYPKECRDPFSENHQLAHNLSDNYRHNRAPIINTWDRLIYLHTELRKLEELNRLLAIEEKKLTERDRRAINQIREKFDKRPLWLLNLEEAYRIREEYEGRDGSGEKIRIIMREIVKDEIQFWKFLYDTNREIRKEMLEFVRELSLAERDSRESIKLVESNHPSWPEKVRAFSLKYPRFINLYSIDASTNVYGEKIVLVHLKEFQAKINSERNKFRKDVIEFTGKIEHKLRRLRPR